MSDVHFPDLGKTIDKTYVLTKGLGAGGYARVYLSEVNLDKFDYATVVAYREKRQKKQEVETAASRGEQFEKIDQRLEELRKPEWAEKVRSAVEKVPNFYPHTGICAVKILDIPQNLKKHDRRNRIERFQGEWKNLMGITHLNVIRVYGGGKTEVEGKETWYYVMEYLEEILEEEHIISKSPEEKAEIIMSAAQGLRAIHSHKLIHRDIKPGNILVTRGGDVKVSDAGIAKDLLKEAEMTVTQDVIGTPYYESPEQMASSKNVDYRTDIYSLGASFYTWLTGIKPYEDNKELSSMMDILYAMRKLHEYASRIDRDVYRISRLPSEIILPTPVAQICGVPKHITDVVEKMMNPNKEFYRYQSMDEVIHDCNALIHGEATSIEIEKREVASQKERDIGKRVREQEKRKRRTVVFSVTGALVAALLVSIVFFSLEKNGSTTEDDQELHETGSEDQQSPEEEDSLLSTSEQERNYEGMYEYASGFWRDNPLEYKKSIEKFRRVEKEAKGTAWSMKASDAIAEIQKAREQATEEAFSKIRKQVQGFVSGNDFDSALALLDKTPEKFADTLEPKISKERDNIRKEVENKIDGIIQSVETLLEKKKPQLALTQFERLSGITYTPMAARLSKLNKQILEEQKKIAELRERQKEEEARRELERMFAKIDGMVFAGDIDGALKYLAEEKEQVEPEQEKTIRPGLSAIEKVLGAYRRAKELRRTALEGLKGKRVTLEKKNGVKIEGPVLKVLEKGLEIEIRFEGEYGLVTGRIEVKYEDMKAGEIEKYIPAIKPETPEDYIAAGICAIGREDYIEAETFIKKAGDHPIAQRYGMRIDELRMGKQEAAAKRAWERKLSGLIRDAYEVGEAKELLAALDAYMKEHGSTEYAAGRKENIEHLRFSAQKAIDESPEGWIFKLRKIFHGNVVSFNPNTTEIELVYDFQDPDQIKDWKLSRWAWGNMTGGPMKVQNGALHLSATGQCALLSGKYVSVSVRTDFADNGKHGRPALCVCADSEGSFYYLTGVSPQGKAVLGKMKKGAENKLSSETRPSPFASTRRGSMSLSFANGHLEGRVGDCVFEADDTTFNKGQVAFLGCAVDASFDNLHIVGRLDREWLENELRWSEFESPLLARTDGQPFTAVWKEISVRGEKPRGRVHSTRAMTYDSKRRRSILFGGYIREGGSGNDMWALDLGQRQWMCLQKNNPKAPGAGKSFPGAYGNHNLNYDEGNDLYWVNYHWAYNPNRKTWRKACPKKMASWCWEAGHTLIYDPERKGLIALRTSGILTLIRPCKEEIETFPRSSFPGRYLWGGLTYDRKNRVFVVFGGRIKGEELNDTWIFDAQAKTWREMKPPLSPPGRFQHKLMWHEELGAVVMTGPKERVDKPEFRDLWVYEVHNNRWTEVKTPIAPSPGIAATCYDAAQGKVVLFDNKGRTWVLAIRRTGGSMQSQPRPQEIIKPGRSPWNGVWKKMDAHHQGGKTATFDNKRGLYIVVHGDLSVWAYRLRTDRWEKLSEPATDSGKSFARGVSSFEVIYDRERDGLILCGYTAKIGNGPGTLLFDMKTKNWSVLAAEQCKSSALAWGHGLCLRYAMGSLCRFDFSKRLWHKVECKNLPPRRSFTSKIMVYDPPRKRFFLFGGSPYRQPPFNDTWVYYPAKNQWTELKPLQNPSPRTRHTLCYDSENDLIVMQGGTLDPDYTWVYDSACNSWFEIKNPGKPPPGTKYIEYDPNNRCCIVWNPQNGEVWVLHIGPIKR